MCPWWVICCDVFKHFSKLILYNTEWQWGSLSEKERMRTFSSSKATLHKDLFWWDCTQRQSMLNWHKIAHELLGLTLTGSTSKGVSPKSKLHRLTRTRRNSENWMIVICPLDKTLLKFSKSCTVWLITGKHFGFNDQLFVQAKRCVSITLILATKSMCNSPLLMSITSSLHSNEHSPYAKREFHWNKIVSLQRYLRLYTGTALLWVLTN